MGCKQGQFQRLKNCCRMPYRRLFSKERTDMVWRKWSSSTPKRQKARGVIGLLGVSFASLVILAQTALAMSSGGVGIGLNNAYSKANGTYAVVVKDVPGVHLALYVNDKNPIYATVNTKDWATFHDVKLSGSGKISFGRIFTTNGMSYQLPLRYVRYFTVAENGTVLFLASNPNKPSVPVTTPSPTPIPAVSAPSPAPTPTPPQSCHPLTNGGNCYEPGEYCRESDHEVAGIAGDGKSIVCEDNNGWRWEPNG